MMKHTTPHHPIDFLSLAKGIDHESNESRILHRRASIPVSIAVDIFLTLKDRGQRFTRWELFDEVKGQAGSDTLEDSINRELRRARTNYHIRCLDKRTGLYEFLGINYGREEPKQLDLFKAEGVPSEIPSEATPAVEEGDMAVGTTKESIPQHTDVCKPSGDSNTFSGESTW